MIAVTNPSRVDALRRTGLLDSPREEAFDRLTRLASSVLQAPVALVSLVDVDRQFFKSCVGLPEPASSTRSTPLEYSFCQHAIASGEPLVVTDAREHPLVRGNPAIREFGVVAYAGIPLLTDDGHALGTLCVLDAVPRAWTEHEVRTLRDLAGAAMTEISLRQELGNVYSTYGWHPLSVDVAIANVRWIKRNRNRLLCQVERTSTYFVERLRAMAFPEEPEIRWRGLAIGVDVHDEKYAARVAKKCRARGLLLDPQEHVLLMLPALNIDRETARAGLDILEACL